MQQRLRILAAAAMTMLVGILSSRGAQAAGLADAADIHATLDAYVAAHPHAVLVAGVVDGGATNVYAARGKAATAVPDERTRFQIGSVTKTFTATLLARMVEAHEVALDDPIKNDLPAGVRAPEYQGKPITLRSLAEQTSGLPRLATNMPMRDRANPYADYTVAQLYDFLSHYTLTRAPGSEYEYSNFGYTLLGQLLANRAQTTYAALIQRRIFDPLGMKDSIATGTPASRALLVPGFTADDRPQVPWDFGQLGGAGAIESDMHDMLLYVKAYLAAPRGTLGPALALAQKPRVPTNLVPGGTVQIGLAWTTNTRSGITFHNGETGGYHAYVAFEPSTQQAIVVLANAADPSIDAVALHVLVPALVPAPSYAPVRSEASPYAGVYRLSPAFAITVFSEAGQLYAQATGQGRVALTRISAQTFAVQGVDAQVTFDVDAKGVATGLTLHQNGIDQHARKE